MTQQVLVPSSMDEQWAALHQHAAAATSEAICDKIEACLPHLDAALLSGSSAKRTLLLPRKSPTKISLGPSTTFSRQKVVPKTAADPGHSISSWRAASAENWQLLSALFSRVPSESHAFQEAVITLFHKVHQIWKQRDGSQTSLISSESEFHEQKRSCLLIIHRLLQQGDTYSAECKRVLWLSLRSLTEEIEEATLKKILQDQVDLVAKALFASHSTCTSLSTTSQKRTVLSSG